MKRFFALILTTLSFLFLNVFSAIAFYDPRTVPNNKYGLHILDPNEISSVPAIVNSHGGDWGYLTVPIQPSDRDKTKWQTFLDSCLRLHLIPIIRITTLPLGGTWGEAKATDLVDFANFLNELSWPISNRYIILFNEVNRSTEWGDKVDPAAYSLIVKNAYTIFKERSPDFFLLGPALDTALSNTTSSLSAATYLKAMEQADPHVWNYFDGWASHSYPNPNFLASPAKTGWQSIVSYRSELTDRNTPLDKPILITETGWDQNKLSFQLLNSYWTQAFRLWNQDVNVVAVTPFVLQGGEQYASLSLTLKSGELSSSGKILTELLKTPGTPLLSSPSTPAQASTSKAALVTSSASPFLRYTLLLRIENLLRRLFGFQQKAYIRLGSTNLTVELATTPKYWERGLSGRTTLADNEGMLFLFPSSHIPTFWMKDMNFPIDIIWLKDNQILSVESNVPVSENVPLPTYSPPEPVDMVLEVPAGYAAKHELKPGTILTRYD